MVRIEEHALAFTKGLLLIGSQFCVVVFLSVTLRATASVLAVFRLHMV